MPIPLTRAHLPAPDRCTQLYFPNHTDVTATVKLAPHLTWSMAAHLPHFCRVQPEFKPFVQSVLLAHRSLFVHGPMTAEEAVAAQRLSPGCAAPGSPAVLKLVSGVECCSISAGERRPPYANPSCLIRVSSGCCFLCILHAHQCWA